MTAAVTSSGSTATWAPCQWCGNVQHMGTCPRVKAIEYHPNGEVKRVEFFDRWPAPEKTMSIGAGVSRSALATKETNHE